jgi:hypothetical protein
MALITCVHHLATPKQNVKQVRDFVREAYTRTVALLKEKSDLVEAMAQVPGQSLPKGGDVMG